MDRQKARKTLKIGFIVLAIMVIVGYAVFTSHNFIQGPKIILDEPKNGETFNTSSVLIQGTAERSKNVKLNGKDVLIDDAGHFKEKTLLSPGYNVITILVEDKFGRNKEYRLELVYKVD